MKKVRKIVIPVAGLGTRSLPFSKEIPKEMLPIIDTPAIHYIVKEAVDAGIEQVIFVTGRGKGPLEDYFDFSPALEKILRDRGKHQMAEEMHSLGKLCDIHSVRQKEPLGLGHAVLCARHLVGDAPFAVALGDEIYPNWSQHPGPTPLRQLTELAQHKGGSWLSIQEVPKEKTPLYGIVDVGGVDVGNGPVAVKSAVEKPSVEKAPSQFAIVGRYVFASEVFDLLQKTKPSKGGEIQLTDAIDALAKDGSLHAVAIQTARYDVGSSAGYVQAVIDSALSRPGLASEIRDYLKGMK